MTTLRPILLTLSLITASNAAFATPYAVDYNASSINFSGTHAGDPFHGKFARWQADIEFDAEQLHNSQIRVEIHTDSASTNNALYDGTLPTADWFSASTYPTAIFIATHFTKIDSNRFKAEGELSIKQHTHPVSFIFTLEPKKGDKDAVKADFQLSIKRLDYNIGAASDPDASWVSNDITIDVAVRAVDASVLAARNYAEHDIQYYY